MPQKIKQPSTDTKIVPKLSRRQFVIRVCAALLFLGLAFLGWQYIDARGEIKRLSNPTEAARTETEILKDRVGKLVELPNEEPTIATVQDASKLQSQVFFKNAQNGDKVLIFTEAKKAILFRPSTGKVIEVAPVNLGNSASQSGQSKESKK